MIYIITGPPGAGKSTLAVALAARFEKAIVIPIDDMREWVVSGYSSSFNWTDETERQFALAEEAACGMARLYAMQGFAVVLDHCRNLERWDKVIQLFLQDEEVVRVALHPDLKTNLHRNAIRTNKFFDPADLEVIIRGMHESQPSKREEWLILDNGSMTVEETIIAVLQK